MLSRSRGKWFHLPLVAAALLVLGLVVFFARYKLKKHQLQKSQKRSDQMETLLQQMDEALWNEQENVPVGPGQNLEPQYQCILK